MKKDLGTLGFPNCLRTIYLDVVKVETQKASLLDSIHFRPFHFTYFRLQPIVPRKSL